MEKAALLQAVGIEDQGDDIIVVDTIGKRLIVFSLFNELS